MVDQTGVANGGGVYGNFVGTGVEQGRNVGNGRNTSPHRKRNIDCLGYLPNQFDQGFALINGGRNVQKNKLVGPLPGINGAQLDGITRVAEVHEVGAFHGAPVFNVKAGNDSFSEHSFYV